MKEYRIPTGLAAIQWIIWQAAGIGKSYLEYDIHRPYVWVQKGCFLLLLIYAWCFAFYVFRNVRSGNKIIKRGLQIFALYMSILSLILVFLWPGTWSWDDIGVLASARYYDVLPWQHSMSSFFHNLFLQLIPRPGGLILVQLVIAAVIVSYALAEAEDVFFAGRYLTGSAIADALIKLIPFLLPPVILYQYSGFRMGLYIYLEIFVMAFILCMLKKPKDISLPMLFIFGLASGIISIWRSEGFLYAPAVAAIILTQKKDSLVLKKKLFTLAVLFVSMFVMSSFHKAKLGNSDYSVVTFLRPLAEVVRAADPVKDADLLEDIEKVVHTDVILENPGVDGENLLWKHDLEITEYTPEEYSAFMKAFAGLCMRYPKAFAKERIKVFIDTSAIHGRTNPTNVMDTYNLFDPQEMNTNQEEFNEWDISFNRPVSEELRRKAILFLACLRSDFSERITYRLVWDTIIPIMVIAAAWIWMLVKKRWRALIAFSAVAFRLPIVFLTAPATWTMYYLSFYLTGYVILDLVVTGILSRIINMSKHEVHSDGLKR